MLRVGIVGAGAIGCYVAGFLAPKAKVTLVGRPRQRADFERSGIVVIPLKGEQVIVSSSAFEFSDDVSDLADCDAVMIAVKSGHTAQVSGELADVVSTDTLIVSLQNGVGNATVLRERFSEVAASIVTFNVVSGDVSDDAQDDVGDRVGVMRQTTSGPLVLEELASPVFAELASTLKESGLETEARADIARHQWTKLVINLNNAITALSGQSVSGLLASAGYRKLMSAVSREALSVLRSAEIKPAAMRGIPLPWLAALFNLPTPVVKLVARARMKVDPRARSSMWIDLEKRRKTEVDYLNGEIVRLAEQSGTTAPLNAGLVRLVHEAEERGEGPPNLSAETLTAKLQPTREDDR